MVPSRMILHIVSDLNVGGVQHVVMSYLRKRNLFYPDNLFVLVLTSNNHSIYDEEVLEQSFPVEYINFKPVHFFKILGPIVNWVSLQWKLYKKISHYHPDVIHSHGTRMLPYLIPTYILHHSTVLVHTLHSDPTMIPPMNRLIARMAFHCFPIIPICVTESQARCAKQKYRLKIIKVIHNPVDKCNTKNSERVKLRKKIGVAEDSFVIGYVGRFDKVKNISFLIELFQDFSKIIPNTVLILVGDGPEKKPIEELVLSAGLSDKVVFVGFQKDVFQYYGMMDLFMLTSFSESCSISTIEAQVARVRCVVSDCVPQDSVVSDLVRRVPLNADKRMWMDAILGVSTHDIQKEALSSYDIDFIIRELSEIYKSNQFC